jgi:glycosyltransferase involved in cell wall biosynthesis
LALTGWIGSGFVLVYFVNHSSAPVALGGAERSMIRLVADWYAHDPEFEAFFVTKSPPGRFIEALQTRGWNFAAFPFRGWTIQRSSPPASEIAYFARADYRATLDIIALMEKRRPDLVVTNTLVAPWGAFAAATLGIPHAWFVREYGDLDHGLQFQIGRASTFHDIGLLSQSVFVNSFALRSHIANYLDDSKVSVVYPALDAAAIVSAAAEPLTSDPFPKGGLRLVMVGRLSDSKGQWRVIDAVGALAARGILVSLCLVGAHDERGYHDRLRRRARGLGVGDRVVLVGDTPNPFAYMAAADVCVTASGIEAFGRSTLEYMVVGKPVISSAAGGSAELVDDGTTGILFPSDDTSRLAAAIETYSRSPELLASHGRAGQSRATELLAGPHGNLEAIRRLEGTAGLTPYRLPDVARYWFALPGTVLTVGGRGARITATFLARRILDGVLRRRRRGSGA